MRRLLDPLPPDLDHILLDLKEPIESRPTQDFMDFKTQAGQYQLGVFQLQSSLEQDQLAQHFTAQELEVGTIHDERLASRAVGHGVPLLRQLRNLFWTKQSVIQETHS